MKMNKQSAQRQKMSTFPPTNPILVTVCAVALSKTVQK